MGWDLGFSGNGFMARLHFFWDLPTRQLISVMKYLAWPSSRSFTVPGFMNPPSGVPFADRQRCT